MGDVHGLDIERLMGLTRALLAVSDGDGCYVYVSGAWQDFLGYAPDELVGRRFIDFVHPDDVSVTLAVTQDPVAVERGIVGFTNRLVGRDGVVRRVRWYASRGEDGLWYGAAEDVTEAVEAQVEADHARALMERTESISRTGGWRYDLHTGRVTASPGLFAMFGELATRDPFDAESPDPLDAADRVAVMDAMRLVLEDGVQRAVSFSAASASGEVLWVECVAAREVDEQGDPEALVGLVVDMTERHEIEVALRASEAKFAAAFKTSPDAVNINRLRDGLYLEINEGFTALTGYTWEDVAGRTSLELDVWADPADRARLVAGLRADGWVRNLEAQFRRKDGTITTALMSARVMMLDGEACILSVTRDVSQMHAAQEALRVSEARYRMLFTSMLEGLAVCRMLYGDDGEPDDWIHLEVNDMFATLTGLTDAVGKTVCELIPGIRQTNPELFTVYGRAARYGTPGKIEADLSQLGISLSISVFGAGPDTFVAVFEDVTERRRARAELEALNENLEKRVEERTRELGAANDELRRAIEHLAHANAELDEATRAKSDFLASMSHELRTPLNSILGFSGILLEGMAGDLSDEQRRQLTMINNSGRHLLDLINRVLDLAKIEAGLDEVVLEPIDPCDIAAEMIETVRPLAAEKGLTLESQVPGDCVPVRADARRMRQILLNLLGNAVKFTEAGTVRLIVEQDARGTAFVVVDSGRGIDSDEIPRIFDEFYQATAPDGRKVAGTGLGLSVSRALAESMGGVIEVESTLGAGSCFTLRCR